MNAIERRKFLKQSMLGGIGMGGLSLGTSIPVFLTESLRAQQVGAQGVPQVLDAGKDEKILVLLQLAGGNDGLNTVVPYEDRKYYSERKNIAISETDVLKLEPNQQEITKGEKSKRKSRKKGSGIGLHPEMTFFEEMYKEGQLAVINNVGYANPNRSHFKSGAIWQSGLSNEEIAWVKEDEIKDKTGWLGRYFDLHCAGENNMVGAYYGENPLVMQGNAFSGTSISDIGSVPFGFMKLRKELADTPEFRALQKPDAMNPKSDNRADFVRNVANETQQASDEMRRYLADGNKGRQYPQTGLGKQFKTISEFIIRGANTRVYLAKIGGFDTHKKQSAGHANLWKLINGAIRVFMTEMKELKLDKNVALMTFSEFGRQVKENSTEGTDHGSAAPMFILGGDVKPGIYGNTPKLREVTGFGGLAYEIDFRQVYRSVIEQFLNADSKDIISETYEPFDLFKGVSSNTSSTKNDADKG